MSTNSLYNYNRRNSEDSDNSISYTKVLVELRSILTVISKIEGESQSTNKNTANNNLSKHIEKFDSSIKHSLEQVDNKLSLNSINLPKDIKDEVLAKDPEIIKKIEALIEEWSNNLDKAYNSLSTSSSNVKTASNEIDNRKRVISNLTILFKQIKSENTLRILNIIKLSDDVSKRQNFINKIKNFESLYEDSFDYLKFLFTLERSIKDLTSNDMMTIQNSITGIFHNLKIIYLISKHRDSSKFGTLLEIIAKEICDKISSKIVLKDIFNNTTESITILDQANDVAKKWKTEFGETKAKTKWEYGTIIIIGKFEHLIKICGKLKTSLEKVKEYLKFLGPELKRVIGAAADKIDYEREKVFKACSYIKNYSFNIFDKDFENSLNEAFKNFDYAMKELENDTVKLIDDTFEGELRSAESAYDLYINFENLIQQEEIQQAMKKKYIKILDLFIKEVETTDKLFEENKHNPPISKAKPLVAGKIAWARLLYLKMKKPISKIFLNEKREDKENNNINITNKIDTLRVNFVEVGKKLQAYEKQIFEEWKAESLKKFIEYLHNFILKKEEYYDKKEKKHRYIVNFDPRLKLMIRNTKFLNLYGFEAPKNINNLALEEVQKAKYCNSLSIMLKEYDSLINSLDQRHNNLLKPYIERLEREIDKGSTSHNWTSFSIQGFIDNCKEHIKQLSDKANSVFKSEEKIYSILKQISNSNLVREIYFSKNDNKEIGNFLTYYDDHRKKVIYELLNKYEDISNIILEIQKVTAENIVSLKNNTDNYNNKSSKKNNIESIQIKNNDNNRLMSDYYNHWEKTILASLTKAILRSIISIYEMFKIGKQPNNENILFTIKSRFINSKEIMFNPNSLDIDQLLRKFIKSFWGAGSEFIRWIDGTCKPPLEYKDFSEDKLEAIVPKYTYDAYISENDDIRHYAYELYLIIKKIIENMDDNKTKYMLVYIKEEFGNWNNSKAKVEKDLERHKSLRHFEIKINKMLVYMDNFKKKFSNKRVCEGNYIINNEELNNKGVEQLKSIINNMLTILVNHIEEIDLKNFKEEIEKNKEKINEKVVDPDSLKQVLSNISEVHQKQLDIDLKTLEIEEKIHFLELYNYNKIDELKNKFNTCKKEWSNLRVKAIKKDKMLDKNKIALKLDTENSVKEMINDLDKIYSEYESSGPTALNVSLDDGLIKLDKYNILLEELKSKKNSIVQCQKLFGIDIIPFNQINIMSEKNAKIEPLYQYYKDFLVFYDEQVKKAWSKVDTNALQLKVEEFNDKMKFFKQKGLLTAFRSQYQELDNIRETLNNNFFDVIAPLKNPIIDQRIINSLMKDLKKNITINFNGTSLQDILKLNLSSEKEKIATLVDDANQESKIKDSYLYYDSSLDTMSFRLKMYKRGNDEKGYIFEGVTDEMDKLQEYITNLQSLSSNKHAGSFKKDINKLENELNSIMETVEVWVEVQKKWMYLESIFIGSDDIRQKLPEETKEFEKYDKKFKQIMQSVSKKNVIRDQTKDDKKLEILKNLLSNYEKAEKKLTEHLDSKKNEFSRFYFLTEADLLQILGSSNPLQTLNPQMIKLYQNCKELIYDKGIVGMLSEEGEKFYFKNTVKMESQQQVGVWMNKVDNEIKSSLKQYTREGIQSRPTEDRIKFIKNKLGQVTVFALECWWTFALEDVFNKVSQGDKYAMKKELERQSDELQELVKVVRSPNMSTLDRKKINQLIIRTVNGRDIVDRFVRDSILDAREFEWECQLKFSWEKDKDDLKIRQCNGEFISCFEYQGVNGRLVITPLTERCVMTITTALTFYLGSAPAGPAGTGKTETVKDLGKGMGIRVMVQNCTNTLDYIFMGQFFSGLSQTGFWGCFDEFNRINPEVLSVVTTQIKSVQTSLSQKRQSWILMNKEVLLIDTMSIFITMNPNYEGRSDLPDNLKALFRPITMIVPNKLLICENILLSEGFLESKHLAYKIDKLYKLCVELLSRQHHYDWTLRTVIAVLSSAGILKRKMPEWNEEKILMRAMRDMNVPKFIVEDKIIFLGIIKDLFPKLNTEEEDDVDLKSIVETKMKELKYEVNHIQIEKIMQMYEIMQIKHTTMICGPPASGKSCILEVLRKTVEHTEKLTDIIQYVINPKAQTIPRLYGIKNEVSGDFEIGILAHYFQIANQPLFGKKERRWVLLDGDVDPIWIENMNSVMDDSKQLTLENKDRIFMQKYCNLVMESSNITSASLATISRLGMVFIDQNIIESEHIFLRWLNKKNNKEYDWEDSAKENLKELYKKIIPPMLKYIFKGIKGNEEDGTPLKLIINQCEAPMINQLCNLIDTLIPKKGFSFDHNITEQIFVFSTVWSLGSCIIAEDREKFSTTINEFVSSSASTQNVYSKKCDINKGIYELWDNLNNIIPECNLEGKKFNEMIIPTMDTKRYSWLLGKMIENKMPVMFVGEPGTGKTITIQNYLKFLTTSEVIKTPYVILSTNFSSRTTSLDFQNTMQDILESRLMRVYGPTSGKQLIIYIDDISMPKVDKYDTQEPIAFLKLLVDKRFYYTVDNKDKYSLIDTNFVCSTLPPSGGNNKIDSRFIALFNTFNITADQSAINNIFDTIVTHYLSSYPEDMNMHDFGKQLVKATIELYNQSKANLKRTPIKFHYTFNIRDISKIFQGFCQINKEAITSKDLATKLWKNEASRVISDKLLSISDKQLFENIISGIIKKYFSQHSEFALSDSSCLFGDFMKCKYITDDDEFEDEVEENKIEIDEKRVYEQIESYEHCKQVLQKALDSYNCQGNNQAMDLVLYNDAIDHILRIHRILRIEGGNALLVGVGGSGKQSLVKLASYLAKYELYSIKISANFNEKALKEQLLELFRLFIPNQPINPITFLFTDEQILDESFMELINNILTIGIVPAILEKSDKDYIDQEWGPTANELKLPNSRDTNISLFVKNIKENLHMAIAMSPSGDKLRNRCRNFPGLIANTIIDWFFEWPEDALLAVSSFLIRKINIEDDLKLKICNHMNYVHISSTKVYAEEAWQIQKRRIYMTPKNFLDYIKSFIKLYNQYNTYSEKQIIRLEKGLSVISSAGEKIEKLKEEVGQENVIAQEKLENLTIINQDLEIKSAEVKNNTEEAIEKEKALQINKAEVIKESQRLDIVIEENSKLVQIIKEEASNIDEKKYNMQSGIKKFTSDGGVILKGIYFILSKQLLKWDSVVDSEIINVIRSGSTVLPKLRNVEDTAAESNLNLKNLDEAYKRASVIEIDKAKNAAIWSLQQWILKFRDFAYQKRDLEENKANLEEKKITLNRLEEDLIETNLKLSELNENKQKLEELSAQKKKEHEETQEKVDKLTNELNTATDLFNDLKSEQERWAVDKEKLINNKKYLCGEVLLASAFLSYAGPFSFEFRRRMIYSDWKNDIVNKGILIGEDFNVKELLTSELTVSKWNLEGLPDDELSVQNGILTEQSDRYPLCIDPEMQAIKWIKGKEQMKNKPVLTFNNPDYMRHIENAIQNGDLILIENIQETLDPNINTVLNKNIKKKNQIPYFILDGKEINYNSNFRLFMTTKGSNPHYSAEIMAKTTVINYSVTMDGLEDQLLNDVIRHEQSALEEKRKSLVYEMNNCKIELSTCEERLLEELFKSENDPNILKNTQVINTLKTTKYTAKDVKIKLDNSLITKKEVDNKRDSYKSVAKRGSILYFTISALRLISPMYEYSLSNFQSLFIDSMKKSKFDNIVPNRLTNIKDKLTTMLFEYTCLGIFEQHKLMFTFHMRIMIMKYEEKLDSSEIDFFLRGNPTLSDLKQEKKINWMSDIGWKDLDRLITINEVFSNLMQDIIDNEHEFRDWYDLEKPENNKIPCGYNSKLSELQKLLVLRVFRPDRIYNGIKNFIDKTMGNEYIKFPSISMDKIYEQSNEKIPILFILSPGVDPFGYVNSLAIKQGMSEKKFRPMSLGQKQEKEARDLIIDGAKRGIWVMLQNCDLLQDWLKDLENIIEGLTNPKPEFRLWLTTSPIDEFPIGLLQKSYKIVTEPPDGLNLNMNRVFQSINEDQLEKDCVHYAYKPLLYTLCFFHSVIQDRKKFGKIGWNILYDFSESDFVISQKLLATYLGKLSPDDQIPWNSLKYLIGSAMYGGRVTDDFDRRMMLTYLDEYMGDFIFDKNHQFQFSNLHEKFVIPDDGPYDMYLKWISDLPSVYSPEVIGLHSNAEINYFTDASKLMWNNLIILQSTSTTLGNSKGDSKEQAILELLEGILTKLPQKYDINKIKKKLGDKKSPIDSVLLQELENFNKLLIKIDSSLNELRLALIGETSMNPDIESLMNYLYTAKLPASWKKLCPETQKQLGNWFQQLIKRSEQYTNWIENGEPKVMWISGLHVPSAYLKAIIQSTSRKKGWPLDKVDTYTVVTKYYDESEVTNKLEFGCYLSGLYLEGAEWSIELNSLVKQTPKKLITKMPLIQVIPAEASKIKLRNNLKTPVYVTQNRDDKECLGLVFVADLRTIEHPNNWILQGVCLVLNIS